jgi:hypothetical protein
VRCSTPAADHSTAVQGLSDVSKVLQELCAAVGAVSSEPIRIAAEFLCFVGVDDSRAGEIRAEIQRSWTRKLVDAIGGDRGQVEVRSWVDDGAELMSKQLITGCVADNQQVIDSFVMPPELDFG